MFKRFIQKTTLFSCLIIIAFDLNAQSDHWETVVYDNSTWKYLIPTASTPTNWISPSFDASSWNSGIGGFGFGDGDDNTALPNGTISVYQRFTFTIIDVSLLTKAILNMDYDDGFVAYLNGVEIARNGLTGTGQPSYNQLASISHEAVLYAGGYPDQFVFTQAQVQSAIVNGPNVLCVETHNQTAGSSDFTSRAFLSVGISNTSTNYGPTPAWFVPPVELSSSNLPIVILNTNGVTIPDEPKIDGFMGIIDNGPGVLNHINDPTNEFYGQIAIERRGSSSNSFPMKSYGLETRGPDTTINYNASIFDWPADNDWILYAPYTDKALIRNVLTYKMGTEMGRWAPRTKMCEVVLNGEYIGVYVFMERIKVNPGRVDIDPLNYNDTLNNELTGGYIFKIDKTTAGGIISWNSPYTSAAPGTSAIRYELHDPEAVDMHPTQKQYIEDFVTSWEDALAGPNFTDPVLGYKPFIDEASFIDFMLVNEVSKNVDGYRISTYLHKNRVSEGGEIVAGPLWDFNLGFGNANYCEGGDTTGWEINFNSICGGSLQNPFWWSRLLQDSTYSHAMKCRWLELRQTTLSNAYLMNYIDSMALLLTEPAARNYNRWPILGTYVWPNNFIGDTYQEEVDYMKNWLTGRLTWMDNNMFGTCNDLGFDEFSNEIQLKAYPNPTEDKITLRVNDNLKNVALRVVSPQGTLIHSEEISNFQETTLDFSTYSDGIYFVTVQQKNGFFKTIKITVK
ncbi:MAG: CotH kinase family protein [Crocinitomicaceae bacterium]|nr:CotH kinase family protein [Crocinitomicaceae bacterium]